MESYEALAQAINRDTIKHAKALRLSLSMVNKWQEPSSDYTDSGALNPLDRIETVIDTALKCDVPKGKAHAPIRYLAHRFGLEVVPVPKSSTSVSELHQQLLRTIKEFGDLAAVSSDALEDQQLSRKERKDITKEGWEVVEATVRYIRMVEGTSHNI